MSGAQQGHSEVRIKLKHGDWEVEISCQEEKVKEVVDRVLSSLDTRRNEAAVDLKSEISKLRSEIDFLKQSSTVRDPAPANAEKTFKAGMTCRGMIEKMWAESFFASERPLREVHDELARRGYNYDRTAVSHSLSDLVREGILARTGTMRNYQYVQRRPPVEVGLIDRQPLPS